MSSSVILLQLFWTLLSCTDGSSKEVLELLTLLPYYTTDQAVLPSWHDGDNIYPGLKLAQDQINSNPTILQNYTLNIIQGQSFCQFASHTISSFVHETFSNRSRKIVGLLGPGCSSSSLALAPVTNRSEIALVMVHNSGAAALTDRDRYKYHLGNLGTTDNFVLAAIALMDKWSRVAVLYDETRQYYLHIKEGFIKNVKNTFTKVEYLTTVSLDYIPLRVVQQLKLRAVVIMCPAQLTRHIICLSLKEHMTYDSYQYVTTSQTEADLVQNVSFRYNNEDIFCSEREMKQALEGNILLTNGYRTSIEGVLQPFNETYKSYLDQYKVYRDNYNAMDQYIGKESVYSNWTGYFYDSLWAWALVLDNLTKVNPQLFDTSSRTYGNDARAELITEEFYRIEFEGVSGHFSFDRQTGFTFRTIDVIQNASEGYRLWQVNVTGEFGQAPYQIPSSFPVTRVNLYLARFLAVAVAVILILIVIMQAYTYKNRDKAVIKGTTPKLLHLSYCGVYVLLVGLFVYILFSAYPLSIDLNEGFCQLMWIWTIPIGITLSLGPICMRTWRLYRIFIHYLNPGPFISNPILLTAIFFLLLVDIVLAVVWTAMEKVSCRGLLDNLTYTKRDRDHCTTSWFFVIVMAYKAALLLCVTTLAILTKSIKKLSFTTKSLRFLVYSTAAISIFGISLDLIFAIPRFHPNYKFVTLTTTIISLSIAFILCIFLPPLLPTLNPMSEENKSELTQRLEKWELTRKFSGRSWDKRLSKKWSVNST